VVALDDARIRAAALSYISRLAAQNGGVATWQELIAFELDGRRIPLVGQAGIRKITGLDAALTILTTYKLRPEDRPYDDSIGPDGYPRYKWRGTEAQKYDNRALRIAMGERKPLAWFEGVDRCVYLVHSPVWLVGEERNQQQFVVALDLTMRDQWQSDTFISEPDRVLRREYAEVIVKQRLHQPMFKRRVVTAYRTKCAVCRLGIRELLEAAHIKADSDGGQPVVSNGISLCAIHHRAFDRLVVGIRPDYVVEVRNDVLELEDGPTLRHALQGVHGIRIEVPAKRDSRPDSALLEERWERFASAC
jgi:putative restriction endonuclease